MVSQLSFMNLSHATATITQIDGVFDVIRNQLKNWQLESFSNGKLITSSSVSNFTGIADANMRSMTTRTKINTSVLLSEDHRLHIVIIVAIFPNVPTMITRVEKFEFFFNFDVQMYKNHLQILFSRFCVSEIIVGPFLSDGKL